MIYHSSACHRVKLLCAAGIMALLLTALAGGARAPMVIGASLSLSGDFSAEGLAFRQGYQF